MTDTYGSVADGRRLLRREREPITGRIDRTRDEKGRGPQRPARPTRVVVVAGAVVLALALAGGAAAAVAGGSDDDRPDERSEPTAAPTTTATDPPAAAILLVYSGGRYTQQGCTDLLGVDACSLVEYSDLAEQLSVRCTPDGCDLSYNGQSFPLDGPVEAAGTFPHSDEPSCGEQSWTLALEPVGEAETNGLRHPARLRGLSTTTAPASLPSTGVNCLGRDEIYVVDAVPE